MNKSVITLGLALSYFANFNNTSRYTVELNGFLLCFKSKTHFLNRLKVFGSLTIADSG